VTIRGGKMVWIDHCTFVDCGDGCIDITNGANDVTVSWCKFYYVKQPEHRYTMLTTGRTVKVKKKKKLKTVRVTLHHNWWAQGCNSRMPAARKADIHMYNNYFNCPGNFYCTNARADASILSESNYYQEVQNPIYAERGGRLKTRDNLFDRCTGKAERRDDKVFKPPYEYTVTKVKKVPEMVKRGAGAR
jgi:pectate lyase